MHITVLYDGTPRRLEIEPNESICLLRHQIWSLTGVELHEQSIAGLGVGLLREEFDELPIASLNLSDGTWATLDRKKPSPAPQVSPNIMASNDGENEMRSRLLSGVATAKAYDNPAAQAAALRAVPWERLQAKAAEQRPAAASSSASPDLDELRVLLHWFKHEFFKWVDRPACEVTGQPTEHAGMGVPTPVERSFGAGRVELYRGPTGHITRFPRYNDPVKLLSTRCGRCGEWANCFTLICKAVGFDARWVLDVTDHVWTEIYSHQMGRWLHADPCEATCDAPMTYERGWGKKLSYVLAFSSEEAVDVSRRYADKWHVTVGRRMAVREAWLRETIQSLNTTTQAKLTPERRAMLAERGAREEKLLDARIERAMKPEELRGRQTGSLAWRKARGEIGSGGGGKAPSNLRVVRVCGATGDVVHGLIFELSNGTRLGTFLENSQEPMDLTDESGLLRRGGRWEALEVGENIAEGEVIVGVSGRSSRIGFLCGSVELKLNSGRSISFVGGNANAFGEGSFNQDAPPPGCIGCVHFCDGDFLCAEFLDESDDEAVVDVGDGAAARNEARDPELLWPGDLVSLVSFSGALRTDLKDAKEPGNVDSWATRFRILRLDGPSEGPISTEHEIGFFSDGCGRRLDISKAGGERVDSCTDGPTTLLEIQLRDDEAPLDEPLRYHQVVALFNTEGGEDKPGAWRLSCCVAQADSLDTENEGTRLRLVPKRE